MASRRSHNVVRISDGIDAGIPDDCAEGRPADRESKQRIVLHPDPGRLWAEADFGQRRELVRLVVERVRVMPARRGARFDPARVQLDIPLVNAVASAAPGQ